MSESLRSFRRNAVHVRQALDLLEHEAGRMQMDGGYLQDEGLLERYKRLSIPVRRALNGSDRASFAQALAALQADRHGRTSSRRPRRSRPGRSCSRSSTARSCSAARKCRGARFSPAGSTPPRSTTSSIAIAPTTTSSIGWGKAAEGMGAQLMEDAARVILLLDEAAAAALGEPVILPPPAKTPPPPPDPKESWWKRLFGGRTKDED